MEANTNKTKGADMQPDIYSTRAAEMLDAAVDHVRQARLDFRQGWYWAEEDEEGCLWSAEDSLTEMYRDGTEWTSEDFHAAMRLASDARKCFGDGR